MPVLDYEFDGPDSLADLYDQIRPDFAETFSPRLPLGLNLGAQLFWQARTFPAAFSRADRLVTDPQYWAWPGHEAVRLDYIRLRVGSSVIATLVTHAGH